MVRERSRVRFSAAAPYPTVKSDTYAGAQCASKCTVRDNTGTNGHNTGAIRTEPVQNEVECSRPVLDLTKKNAASATTDNGVYDLAKRDISPANNSANALVAVMPRFLQVEI